MRSLHAGFPLHTLEARGKGEADPRPLEGRKLNHTLMQRRRSIGKSRTEITLDLNGKIERLIENVTRSVIERRKKTRRLAQLDQPCGFKS